MKNLKNKILSLILSAFFVLPFFVQELPVAEANDVLDWFTQEDQGLSFTQYEGALAELSTEGYDPSLVQSTDFREYVLTIVNFALGFLGLIAVIIVIYGGVLYVTAAGEEENTSKGKKAIQYAVIGLLIVLGSFALVNTVIRGALGQEEGSAIRPGSATAVGAGFNASAEQVRALAQEIYSGYTFLVESAETITGIQSDLEKESVNPEMYPSKSNVLAFLNSIKSKLSTLRTKVPKFSVTSTRTLELIREIDFVIDQINSLGRVDYMKIENGQEFYCSDEPITQSFIDEVYAVGNLQYISVTSVTVAPLELNHARSWDLYQPLRDAWCVSQGYQEYLIGLYSTWQATHAKYSDSECSADPESETIALCELITPIAEDYAKDLRRIFFTLDELFNTYSQIEAIKDGKASSAYNIMKGSLAYGFDVPTGATEAASISGGALESIEFFDLDSEISEISARIYAGLEAQQDLYDAFKDMQFVDATLSADVIEGTAPLSVIFDTVGSIDPAGGTIRADGTNSNILWDLGGTLTWQELMDADGGIVQSQAEVFECENTLTTSAGSDADVVGVTAKRCIFHQPGTYNAAIKIKSNDPTQYAPGISVLTIKVSPPTAKINLDVKTGGANYPVMAYDENTGALVTNKTNISVTGGSAKLIEFDASASQGAEQYRWDFGNGETQDWDSTGTASTKYEEPGKYQVTLDVLSPLGVQDSKIFTINVSALAAVLKSDSPNGSPVNQEVEFDASQSSSDNGAIASYKYEISPVLEGDIPSGILEEIQAAYPVEEQGSSLKTFTHEFRFPLEYNIVLTVKDGGSSSEATDSILNYRITSEDPVADFDYSMPDDTQPNTVHFDGGKSFDPDGTEYYTHEWSISPSTYEVVNLYDHGLDSSTPYIKFLEKTDYEVTLTVTDQINPEEKDEITKTITIDNILDVAWDPNMEVIYMMDDEGEAEAYFEVESDNAIAYEIDFGDGTDKETGDIRDGISHTYTKAGKYQVSLSVYDEDDNENTVQRNIFIGSGDMPIAQAIVRVNNEEVLDLTEPIVVTKADTLQFDASESVNADGTGRNLKYSWNFGDTDSSSKELAIHKYDELSPRDPGYYEVKLTVVDEDDATLTASETVMVKVINIPPKFANVIGIPHTREKPFITPVPVTLKAYGTEDEDGQIVKYRWWYFNVEKPDDPIDMAISQAPTAQLTIGTNGQEGEEITYGFGLEVTDNDNITYSNQEDIDNGNYSTVTVTNGANEMPTANFSMNTSTLFAGEEITFTSSSTDPDGSISKYYWDFEGDGFFNNESTTESTVKHIYNEKNLEGFDVRLKVIDDKGGEAISSTKKVYVDSKAQPPTAAFKYEVIEGSNGMKVQFLNNSTVDEEAGAKVLAYEWDFDTASDLDSADSDGDGLKDNDIDSDIADPKRLYTQKGFYQVKLTIIDNQGNVDEVINEVKVPLANAPTAAFTYELVDGKIKFTNNSLADENSDAQIKDYIWDFDTASELQGADSNGDGVKDNDKDSTLSEPEHEYPATGTYAVKLTVIDDQGNESFVINNVDFSIIDVAIENPEPTETEEPSLDDNNSTNETPALSSLVPVIITEPAPAEDGMVYLEGDEGSINFNFSQSKGTISTYSIDKNIYFDTDGNGVKYDDNDFSSPLPGTWTTNFEKEWGRIVVQLTVKDINGNESSTTVEIKFED